MNSAETLEAEKKPAQEAQTLALELVSSKPSNFIMDGPGTEDYEKVDKTLVIMFPSYRWIRRTSRVKHYIKNSDGSTTFIYKKIRYINGCPIIDVDEQNAKGFKPNHLSDLLFFKDGSMRVTKEGDIGKFLYLQACEYNTSVADRPDDAEDVFKEINTLVDLMADESIIDDENEAMAVLSTLKKKEGSVFVYNEDRLMFLCNLFKIAPPEGGYKTEAWVALASYAKSNPKNFIKSIANTKSLIEADVFSAIQHKVVIVDEARAFFEGSNLMIMTFDTDLSASEKAVALIDFMANPKNSKYYEQLRLQLKAKKESMVGVIS